MATQPQQEPIDTKAALAAIKAADQAPPAEVVEIPEDVICPRCSYNQTQDRVKVTEADKEEFHRCLMAMRPFTKKFKLWGGDLQITMTSLSHEETDVINRKLRSVRAEDQNEILELSVKLKLLLMCREITTTEKQELYEPPENLDDIDISTAFRETFVLPEMHLRILSRTFTEFGIITDILSSEGFDENFYKGGGGA